MELAAKKPAFTDRELTVQEAIWMQKARRDHDYESMVLLMESRLIDDTLDLRSIAVSDFSNPIRECVQGLEAGDALSHCLISLGGQKEGDDGKPNNYK
jgi:hypothetical protein